MFRDLFKFVDDMCVAHDTQDKHVRALVAVFERLASKGYSVKAKKVQIMPETFVFLGHKSTPDGLQPTDRAQEALTQMPVPVCDGSVPRDRVCKQIRSFLGLASYNRRYVKSFSKIAAPLNRLLEKDATLTWTKECQTAWDTIIKAIVETKGVYHPDYTLPFHLRVDASKDGVGGYLFQRVETKDEQDRVKVEERVIEYFSRSLPKPIRNYDTRRLELLAILEALEHFRPVFEGRRVHLESDHRNLTYLRNQRHMHGQLGRWAMRLEEFNHELQYRPGHMQPVSDCLSRNPIAKDVELDKDGEPVSTVFATASDQPLSTAFLALEKQLQGRWCVKLSDDDAEVEWNDEETYRYAVVTSQATLGQPLEFEVEQLAVVPEELRYEADAPPPEQPGAAQEEEQEDEETLLNQTQPEPVTFAQIAAEQQRCDACKEIRRKLELPDDDSTGDGVKKCYTVERNVLYRIRNGEKTIFVPVSLRTNLIRQHHEDILHGHAGRAATMAILRARYYWPYMQADVDEFIRACLPCRKAKSTLHRRHGLLQQSERGGDLRRLSIDLFGPLPSSGKDRYLLVMFDPFSHFLVIEVISTKEATSIFDAFVERILLKGYLPTQVIISDNGTEFKNELFREFIRQLRKTYKLDGVGSADVLKHVFVAVYSPQQNPVERVNRFIKAMLKICVGEMGGNFSDWPLFAKHVEFVYNSQPIPGTSISPFQLRFGHQPITPSDWDKVSNRPTMNLSMADHLDGFFERHKKYHETVRRAHSLAQAKQKLEYDQRHIDIEYEVGDQVLAYFPNRRNKLCYEWRGPYVIVEKLNAASYRIRDALSPTSPTRLESIRNIVRITSLYRPVPTRVPAKPKQGSMLQKGKFVIFRTKSWRMRDWKKELYVGEIYDDYDPQNDFTAIHYYSDFGPQDRDGKADLTKPLQQRTLRPEYKDENGKSFTVLSKKTAKSEPCVNDFTEKDLDIIVANFDLHGTKIPRNIADKAYKVLQERDRRHPAPRRRNVASAK